MKKTSEWFELLRSNLKKQIEQAIQLGYASPDEIREVVAEYEQSLHVESTDYERIAKG